MDRAGWTWTPAGAGAGAGAGMGYWRLDLLQALGTGGAMARDSSADSTSEFRAATASGTDCFCCARPVRPMAAMPPMIGMRARLVADRLESGLRQSHHTQARNECVLTWTPSLPSIHACVQLTRQP